MNIDDLISTLFKDVASPSGGVTPVERIRQGVVLGAPPVEAPRPSMSQASPVPSPMRVGGAVSQPQGAPMAAPAPSPAPSPAPLSLNPLGTMARGYQSGGLFGAISNLFDEPQLLQRQAQEEARVKGQALEQQNQTVQAIIARDPSITPAQAAVIARDPAMLREIFKQPDEMADLKRQKMEAEIENLRRSSAGGSVQYGSTPYWTQDGRPYVMGSDGSAKFVDLGDAKPLAPGELASEKAQGAATGKARGEAKAALPAVLQTAGETVKLIDSLLESDGLDRIVGTLDSRTPNLFPAATEAQARWNQIKGRAFLEGFKSLRGGGQITEKEGQAAMEAVARLDQAQDEKAARAALQDLRDVARNAAIRAQVDAGALGPEVLQQMRNFEGIADLVAPPPRATQSTNPRAPGYQAKSGTIDAGDGFTVKVK